MDENEWEPSRSGISVGDEVRKGLGGESWLYCAVRYNFP